LALTFAREVKARIMKPVGLILPGQSAVRSVQARNVAVFAPPGPLRAFEPFFSRCDLVGGS